MKRRSVFYFVIVIITLCITACSPVVPKASQPSTIIGDYTPSTSPAATSSSNQTTHTTLPTGATKSADGDSKSVIPDFSRIGEPFLIGDKFKFTEGPAWDSTKKVLYFSDIEANRIYQLALPNTLTVFREPSNKSNGLTFDMDGNLLAAEHSSRSVTLTLDDGTIKTIADNYLGKKLNSPNDLVVRADGTIYFTDPRYGLENRPRGVDFMGLYWINKSGEVVLEGKFDNSPNGVALSPDQKTLYLALTTGNQVMVFGVAEDGATTNGRIFVSVPQPDGITVDKSGNLYAAGQDGIYIFSPSGTQLGKIKTGRQPTNCEFGGSNGRTLFITAREALYSVELPIPGL